MLLSCLFIALAAVLNAVMDSVEYETAFEKSIFNRYNPKWWCKSISWKYVKFIPFTKYRPDAWHLAKSGMIVFLLLAVVVYTNDFIPFMDFVLLGLIWNMIFNLFYNKIFRR
jgi:hypothetical protein